MNEYILPATMQEFNEAQLQPSNSTWFVRVDHETYIDGEFGEEPRYYKFQRAYEVKISDFYGHGNGLGFIKRIVIV